MRPPLSLGMRLFLSVSLLNMLTLCVVGLLGLRSADIKISEEYDAQLITETNVLWQVVHQDVGEGDTEEFNVSNATPLLEEIEVQTLLKYAQWRAFRVWKDRKVVIRSDNTDDMPDAPFPPGFSDAQIEGETWRVFALSVPEEGIVVETFENLHNRQLLQRDILFGVAGPLTVMLPLLGFLVSLSIGFGLKSLHSLAQQLTRRSPTDLSRLPTGGFPKELQPLTRAVNGLLAKLDASLRHEREFIDHAAHELRTPLSALKLQAQLLAKSLEDPVSKAGVAELLASVDRTARLVDQLLLLSRVAQQDITLVAVNLHQAVTEAISMYAVRIVDKHIHLSLHGDEAASIEAQAELLRMLIGTILDNAIKYTPDGGDITIAIERDAASITLSVTDSGEGIPESQRALVFDRFYRVPHTRQSGSGLGLAIASQIAGSLHAEITLATPESGRGLRVVIAFPA